MITQYFCFSTSLWSEWRDSNARLPAPKAGALPTGLHPVDVRRNSLRSVSASRRKLPIRSFLLPLQSKPALLGLALVYGGRGRNSLRSVSASRRKLPIRSSLLPFQSKPASLGLALVCGGCERNSLRSVSASRRKLPIRSFRAGKTAPALYNIFSGGASAFCRRRGQVPQALQKVDGKTKLPSCKRGKIVYNRK